MSLVYWILAIVTVLAYLAFVWAVVMFIRADRRARKDN